MVHPKLRVILFLAAFNLAWLVLAWALLERTAWLWALPIALSINFLWWTYDNVLTFSQLESARLKGQDSWGLLKLVHDLAGRFDIAVPQVYLIDREYAQVFTYSKLGRGARLYFTRGALELLGASELRAAVTYQLCVIQNSNGVLNYWLAAWIDLVWRFGLAVERAVGFVLGWSPRLARLIVAPFLWLLQRLLLRTNDFWKLDRQTSARLPDPTDLARALWKLSAYAETRPWADAWVFAHMCMVSPLGRKPSLAPLTRQPPIEQRILKLAGHYPL